MPAVGLKPGKVFGRIGGELFRAGFTAEFDFLTVVHFGDDIAHGAQGITGDDAGGFRIGLDTAGGGGAAGGGA